MRNCLVFKMFCCVLVTLLVTNKLNAQSKTLQQLQKTITSAASDSLASKKDSTVAKKVKVVDTAMQQYYTFNTKTPIPKRAAMYSALLPGLGQLYNKSYWKIPVVYAGVGASAYYMYRTYNNYQLFREVFIGRITNNKSTKDTFKNFTVEDLRFLERSNRARLDRIVVYSAAYYGLNILDALVSAHLKNFDVSKSISMQVAPTLIDDRQLALAVKLHWK
jgi:hypothetical protein